MHKEIKEFFNQQETLLQIAAEYGSKARDRIVTGYPRGTPVRITTNNGAVVHKGVVSSNFGSAIYFKGEGGCPKRIDIDCDTVIEYIYPD